MRKILVHGITSMNVGDDLFFQILKDRYPNSQFIMYAPEAYKKSLEGKNWTIVSNSERITRLSCFLSKCFHLPLIAFLYAWIIIRYRVNLFLIVGGSLFMEGKSHVPNLLKGISKLRIIRPKMKIAILGSNFGPCITSNWKKKVEDALCLVNDVCFRDKPSYDEFSHLSNVRWGNDIVMHFNKYSIIDEAEKRKVVCVNIRSVEKWPSLKAKEEKYINNVISIINHFQKNGYSIRLLSFCKKYGDNEITEKLFNSLDNKKNVERLYYDGSNLYNILSIISGSEYIIATRFHAIVLGLIFNLKVLPISYSVKTENMLKTYNLWREEYDYNVFCDSKFDILVNNCICDFSIDEKNNTMFDYIDKLLY